MCAGLIAKEIACSRMCTYSGSGTMSIRRGRLVRQMAFFQRAGLRGTLENAEVRTHRRGKSCVERFRDERMSDRHFENARNATERAEILKIEIVAGIDPQSGVLRCPCRRRALREATRRIAA